MKQDTRQRRPATGAIPQTGWWHSIVLSAIVHSYSHWIARRNTTRLYWGLDASLDTDHTAVRAHLFFMTRIVPHQCPARTVVDRARFAPQDLNLLHSCANPLLHALVGEKFRRGLFQSCHGGNRSSMTSQVFADITNYIHCHVGTQCSFSEVNIDVIAAVWLVGTEWVVTLLKSAPPQLLI